MGNYAHIYVGPYAKFPVRAVERQREIGATCCGRQRYISAKFCPDCGNALKPAHTTVLEDAISSNAAAEAINERLSCSLRVAPTKTVVGWHLWRPNISTSLKDWPGGEARNLEAGYAEIDPEDIKRECSQFAEIFSLDFARLSNIYHCQPDICFGIITYWM